MNLDGSVRNGNSVHHSPTGSQSGAMEDLLAEAVEDHYRQNSKLVKPSAACSCGCSRRYLRILSSILLRQISSLTPYHLLSLLIYSLKSFLTLYLFFFYIHSGEKSPSTPSPTQELAQVNTMAAMLFIHCVFILSLPFQAQFIVSKFEQEATRLIFVFRV